VRGRCLAAYAAREQHSTVCSAFVSLFFDLIDPCCVRHYVTIIIVFSGLVLLARPTSRCILFDGENISFDASLVIYVNSTNIPPIMIINRIYETQNLLELFH
jgi:hypothetical protein